MAGIDALAAAAAIDANLAAQIDAELAQLAADAQALRGLLVDEMVVTARVLPSNGLTDLVEIAGRRVAASLPPTVRPGDVLQVQVSGFDGDRIVLQIVATGADAAIESPATPGVPAPADVPVAVPRGQPGSAFSSAVSRANVGSAGIAAPSRSVSAGNAGAPFAASSASAPPLRQSVSPPPAPTSIEARVAAARAAGAPTAGDGVAPERSAVARTPGVPQPFVAPPYIAAKPAASSNGAQANSESRASQLASHAVAGRGSQLAAYAEPVALLRALRLPVTPSNVASARLALESPQRLPETLAALERALPQASGDPNVATLRTLLAFVGRIDPRSPALAAQIAAYVDHVVDGAEPKIATLLAASRAAAPDPDPPDDAPPARAGATAPAMRALADPPADAKPLPAALAAERGAALNGDLKQTLLALAADPATPASVAPSLAGALTALTAVQVTAAQTLAANPNGLAFTIPLTTPHGTSNAHISVKREAPDARGGARLDAENFRIAFVLETAHYGTVAIDLVTVGREVTVDVRTEAAPAMRAFRDALGSLTARLESMRYRVASAGASVGTTSTVAVEAPPSAPVDPDATVDRSA